MSDTRIVFERISQSLNRMIVGQDSLIKQLLIALLSGGHVILEGVPGTGKTLTVKLLAQLVQAEFRRIQLTPDVLPSDIIGINIFDLSTKQFNLKKGPIFTQILLADEINRTPPKTQSALLESMEELQVTLDGQTLSLGELFWVIATQNPLEFEGTYPLPEAQLDRFLFKLIVEYPDQTAEKQMLLNRESGFRTRISDLAQIKPLASIQQILTAREEVSQVKVEDKIIDYLLSLVRTSRQHPDLALGASPRAAISWLQSSKANAWLSGKDFVNPDDIKAIAPPLLRHRLILKPEAQLDGLSLEAVIKALLKQVPVPR